MNILLTGASGFIGQEVGKALVKRGHKIFAVSRNSKKARLHLSFPAEIIEGDLNQGPLQSPHFKEIEAVIHLAGENVGEGRWTQERKEKILRSRVQGTENLIQSLSPQVKTLISASAIGFYGHRGDEELSETSRKGEGFLSDVCHDWESSALNFASGHPHRRVVLLRTGVVLGAYGGALMKMLPPFQMGLGGVLGSGQQWMSWIHLQDLVRLYVRAVEDGQMHGVFNAVTSSPVTNRQFTEAMTRALHVRQGPSVPRMALKLLLGEMSEVVLASQKVQSHRLGFFEFLFPSVDEALENCLVSYQEGDLVFYAEQYLDQPREKVFKFFAKAENLETITPPSLSFHILRASTPEIQQGTRIDYQLKIHGVPVQWQTLIDEWKPQDKFVDIQLKGPYRKWHHTHSFEDLGAGTLMRDLVRYKLPLGALGRPAAGFVRKDIEKIFDFRRKQVRSI